MLRSSALRTTALIASVVVIALVVTTIAASVIVVRRPLPTHDGTATVTALDGEVRVLRDERGIPRIYADTDADLMRAQGYVHAQDRFFEMDYRRHVTAGRLSELVGENEEALAADQVIRTLGWRDVAEQEWALMDGEGRALYEAYAEGVNAYLRGREASRVGLEYTVLGVSTELRDIEPWHPVDSLAWLKAMAWDLKGNFDAELGRATALRTLGTVEQVTELYPAYPYSEHLPIVAPPPSEREADAEGESDPDGAGEENADQASPEADPGAGDASAAAGEVSAVGALHAASEAISAVPVLLGEGESIGSNSFVIAGEYTESGRPLLANDPHLGLEAPGLWYQVGLHCNSSSADCTFDVSGTSFAGLPGVIIGQNDQLAWGLTNLGADVTDFVLQRTYDDGTYLRDGARVPLETRTEVIHVNGADPVELTVTTTEHGPLISEVLGSTAVAGSAPVPEGAPPAGYSGYSVALQWTALTPGRSAEAIFALNRATDADDVAEAAAIFEVPAQNIVFATVDGQIGSQAPGRIPVRDDVPDAPVPSDGSWPRPGWDSRYDWQGFVEAEDLPAVVDPEEGFIVAANQAPAMPDAGPDLGVDWDAGYRAQRIRDLVAADIADGQPIGIDRANEIMLDDASPFGPVVVPYLLQVPVDDAFTAEAVEVLQEWAEEGYPTHVDSPGAVYFNAVWRNLLDGTFSNALPSSLAPSGGSRWLLVMEQLLREPDNPWWDDRTTVNVVEGRDEILRQALVDARYELTNTMSSDPQAWRWGKLHRYEPQHPLLSGEEIPAVARWVFTPRGAETSGGTSVVNATAYDATAVDELGRPDFTVTAGPSLRMAVDMGNRDDSTWVTSTGTSGHPASRHYDDQIAAWAAGETFVWPQSSEAVQEAAASELVLSP
ncbi:penicillin acylase family protein [Bogoriella caseilytica]|uniref:Penicillin amidase n=1 Tax=Bogoriella caseilytica TaxID=56055 RepID=A0A3N2BDS8_9MICO|nr:penicillin acylase family protein [Bogoriella caseilytica]ROR73402.1 penicillin amidase [Bogoriella caseilytica]